MRQCGNKCLSLRLELLQEGLHRSGDGSRLGVLSIATSRSAVSVSADGRADLHRAAQRRPHRKRRVPMPLEASRSPPDLSADYFA